MISRETESEARELGMVAETAANHINGIEGILDDYYICFRWDIVPNTTTGLSVLYDYIYNGPPFPIMFGPPFSSISTLLNPVVAIFNIMQVTPAYSQSLRDLIRFPLTLQTGASIDDINPAHVGLVKLMKWKRVAVVFHDIEYFREAYEYGLYGGKYVFLLYGWSAQGSIAWPGSSGPCEMYQILEGLSTTFLAHNIRIADDVNNISFNGLKPTTEQQEYWTETNIFDAIVKNRDRTLYDSIILIAMALNQSIDDLRQLTPPRNLEDFNYKDEEMREIFNYNVRHVEFTGTSVSDSSVNVATVFPGIHKPFFVNVYYVSMVTSEMTACMEHILDELEIETTETEVRQPTRL
ncbi:gamma-aminobutyric acid type B receptor subunit 2-like [Amphiura filiformis]|uniref:gamma-aminobutyric acid type B receptor subunit 2-like n=1 Tax=Amphiura filiformis TaxID=82378 RepID=UPI003B210837